MTVGFVFAFYFSLLLVSSLQVFVFGLESDLLFPSHTGTEMCAGLGMSCSICHVFKKGHLKREEV